MKKLVFGCLVTCLLASCFGCAAQKQSDEEPLAQFLQAHVAKVEPLSAKANLVYWEAATTGKPQKFEELKELQLQIRRIYSDANDFARIKAFDKSKSVREPRLARQLDKLYCAYLQNQIEPDLLRQIVELDTNVQQGYNNFRAQLDGRTVTMSDIYTILTTEKDGAKREAAWRASKQVGNVIIDNFLALVRLRNQAARKLGFDNYHTMAIITGEQNPRDLDLIFEELEWLTREPFARLKRELDAILARSYGIAPADLMPWHYHDPFFQRTPLVYELDLDKYYKGRDVEELAWEYYASIGLSVTDILARSDLHDREGKYPHAFSHDVNRKGDVRVLANLQDTERWMETLLHELGHAIYDKYHDPNEPWLLREPAHSFTTEAIAMFFGRLSRNAAWMQKMLDLSERRDRQDQAGQRSVPAIPADSLRPLGPGHVPLREGPVRQPRAGLEQSLVGPGRELSTPQAAAGTARRGLGLQAALHDRPLLLPQLHAGRTAGLATPLPHRAQGPGA